MAQESNGRKFDILGTQYPLPLNEAGSKTKEQILMEATVLFAKKGYAAVSMRDLAEAIGIKPASLYNHYESKEALWDSVLNETLDLYRLYFRELADAITQAGTFEEILELMFTEPKKWSNDFGAYAFSLIQTEQFRDERAGRIFTEVFLEFSINFISEKFERCISQGMVRKFDTHIVASTFMHTILIDINVHVHGLLGRPLPYDHYRMIADLQKFILHIVRP